MVKIKTKKRMDKKELAQFLIDNSEIIGITRFYKNEEYFEQTIKLGPLSNKIKDIDKNTVEVEVEEEITEDTKLDLVERFIGSMGSVCYTSHNMSIKECLKLTPRDCITTHFYIENGDRELILIWCDGKMVD